jgi:hypothetical protein
MEEVAIRLRFNRPCLGAAKRGDGNRTVFRMARDPAGRVMFMPSAWQGVMRYAAKLANRHQSAVKAIDWNPIVDGEPKPDWRRTIVAQTGATGLRAGRTHYALHEAFCPGDVIGVTAVIPDGMSIDDLWRLLEIVGTYKGFSPFNNDTEKFGTFEVISIKPIDHTTYVEG